MTKTETNDVIALAAGDAQIEIAPRAGGALAGFTFRGTDVLRPTSAAARDEHDVRAHACYPLVPYSNRIANAELKFEGKQYALNKNFGDHPHSIHGVGWQREWQVGAVEKDSALLTLAYVPESAGRRESRTAWPWTF